jgi:hypothetical protein
LADPPNKETVDDFRLNEPLPPVVLKRNPLTNVKLVNVHVVMVIAPVVARTKAEKPDENEVRVVRVSVVLVSDIVPLATETRENPRGVPVAVNKQLVIVSDVVDDEINGVTDVPIPVPNDNSIHVITNAPVFVIPAPVPLVSAPTESVAFADVEFDLTVVLVSVNLTVVALDVKISIAFPLVPVRCADPFVTVRHRNWFVPQ